MGSRTDLRFFCLFPHGSRSLGVVSTILASGRSLYAMEDETRGQNMISTRQELTQSAETRPEKSQVDLEAKIPNPGKCKN